MLGLELGLFSALLGPAHFTMTYVWQVALVTKQATHYTEKVPIH